MDATTFVAIYAAVVASAALVWNIIREKRRIRISLATRWTPTDMTLTDGELTGIGLRVTNIGRFPIQIEVAGVFYSHKDNWGFGQETVINPGMSHVFWFRGELVDDLFDEKRSGQVRYGYVRDTANQVYKIKIPQKLLRQLVRE